MNKIKFLLIICAFLAVSSVYAQRYETASNINVSGGYLNKGFLATVGYEKFFNFSSSIQADLNYMNRKKSIKNSDEDMKLDTYYLTLKYRRYIFSDNALHLYIGAGGLAGSEKFTNEDDFPTQIEVNHKDGFIYGVTGDIGLEYNIKKISLNLVFTPIYEFKNENFLAPVSGGIKYFF